MFDWCHGNKGDNGDTNRCSTFDDDDKVVMLIAVVVLTCVGVDCLCGCCDLDESGVCVLIGVLQR